MEFIKTYNLKLTTLSPLYIGDGRVINGNDYNYADELGLRLPPDGKRILAQNQSGRDKVRDISVFIRNGNGDAYLPGSSVKGAVRTAILAAVVKNRRDDRIIDSALNKVGFEGQQYSIMRAISVCDSLPIDDRDMSICQKIDVYTDGTEKNRPIYRECVKPGISVNLRLNIDVPMFKTLTEQAPGEYIFDVLREFRAQYKSVFRAKFNCNTPDYHNRNIVYLGGNVGFVSKTVTYPLYGDGGLDKVSRIMQQKFRKHKHDLDVKKGVSPHCLKCTKYNRELHEFGICEVEIIDEVENSI
ncbi:MAG: RAMP superfamily CRISPR-associated protein [Clostridiales bacterium]|jgi:CRISPR/Cas system CSM-associated protein Csm5 (group 7 of RAMP superfamily)|nr:RAMP superfamily CRISPR-associated protein [Clostridiales bacterium]